MASSVVTSVGFKVMAVVDSDIVEVVVVVSAVAVEVGISTEVIVVIVASVVD